MVYAYKSIMYRVVKVQYDSVFCYWPFIVIETNGKLLKQQYIVSEHYLIPSKPF